MKKLFVLLLCAIFMSVNAQAVEYYDDGLEHDISTPVNDSIAIYNGNAHIGPPTIVNLQSGGAVGGVEIYDQSIFNVYAGSEAGMIRSYFESNFEIFDGIAHDIELYDFSHGTMSGGTVSYVNVMGESRFSVSGGEIAGDIYRPGRIFTSDYGTAEISGGFVDEVLSVGNSTVEMSDGSVFEMNLHETSSANLTGGIVHSLTTNQNSRLVMTDVIMDEVGYVQAYDSSRVTMTGGEGFIDAMADSVVEISNATVDLAVQENAQVTVSDSQINYLPPELRMNSSLTLTNTDIMMNNNITLYDTSHLTASAGTGLGTVRLYNNSTFTLSGGLVESVGAGGGLVEMTEGHIISLGALDYCAVEITGGLSLPTLQV
jgi:hypothetical protein